MSLNLKVTVMKKLFFLLIAITFTSVLVNAQSTKPQQHKMQAKKNMECYVMKEGKMYHAMAGKEILIEKEIILKNGEKIMPNGMYKMKNGKEMQLKNDECIDLAGNFHRSHMKHRKEA
jgi:hypothetical protein